MILVALDKRRVNSHPDCNFASRTEGGFLATPVVVIAGDGIGPEVTTAMKAVVQAAGADLTWIEAVAGLDAVSAYGVPLPPATLDLIRRYRVAIKGPCTTPVGKGFRSINVQLRKE